MADPCPLPELVAPAGTPEKLQTALHFGADAAYVGMKRFSLRARAGNFGEDELEWALEYAHERGRKVYVAINVQPFDDDLDEIEQTLNVLARLEPDGVVVGDAGVLTLARRTAPGLRIHLSTQASVTNREAATHWFSNGVTRIVLARELSLARLHRLTPHVAGELEVFVHGAMCIAVSGRCFLSLYWAGSHRDPRSGTCAQPCRWPYLDATLVEARYPERCHPIRLEQDGTYFFDSRDLSALPVLDHLVATGVHALKLEGRTRSVHYVGTVVDVYRTALDLLANGEQAAFQRRLPEFEAELQRSTKRGFSTHFLAGEENAASTYQPAGTPACGEAVLLGTVTATGEGWLDVTLVNPLRAATEVEVRDRGLVANHVRVRRLETPGGDRLDLGRPGDVIRIRGTRLGTPGALVRLPIGSEQAKESGFPSH